MSMVWGRAELEALLRMRRSHAEATGPDAYLELKLRVTPEFLHQALGGRWITADGRAVTFEGVAITEDGYADPVFRIIDPVRGDRA